MLMDMGFTSAQATKALRETVSWSILLLIPHHLTNACACVQDGNTERAVEWLFSHPDDMGEDAPSGSSLAVPAAGAVAVVAGDNSLPANYQLKAFISHKGPSVHSGHYVATVRQGDGTWVLFNDEKVALAEGEANERMKSLAYLYIYERVR